MEEEERAAEERRQRMLAQKVGVFGRLSRHVRHFDSYRHVRRWRYAGFVSPRKVIGLCVRERPPSLRSHCVNVPGGYLAFTVLAGLWSALDG